VEPGTLQRLDEGVDRAARKGARDAVVFVEGTAFVVSVRNKTVITAVDRDHMRDHVFTNIDSAVIA
jgi:flagellar operon protein